MSSKKTSDLLMKRLSKLYKKLESLPAVCEDDMEECCWELEQLIELHSNDPRLSPDQLDQLKTTLETYYENVTYHYEEFTDGVNSAFSIIEEIQKSIESQALLDSVQLEK